MPKQGAIGAPQRCAGAVLPSLPVASHGGPDGLVDCAVVGSLQGCLVGWFVVMVPRFSAWSGSTMAPPLTSSTALAPGITASVSVLGGVAPGPAAKPGVSTTSESAATKTAESNLLMFVSVAVDQSHNKAIAVPRDRDRKSV